MRIALRVEYDGGRYHGWETQRSGATVQAAIEAALAKVADEPVSTVCAGRTDARVHALGQTVHFDTTARRPLHAWVLGGNSNLPGDVAVSWAGSVPDDFHARFSACQRHYRYVILNRAARSAVRAGQATWIHRPLDAAAMHVAAQALVGEHDFSSFRAAGCQAKSAVRELSRIRVRRRRDFVCIDVSANAFLQHMVRNISGSLIQVGEGRREPGDLAVVLASRDRTCAGPTAAPHGLYFLGADYPRRFSLPPVPRQVALW